MTSRLLRGCVWCVVATIPFLAPAALGQGAIAEAPWQPDGVAFSVLDPDRSIRDAVGDELGARIVGRVQRDTVRAEVWTQTMFSALAAVSSEVQRLDQEGHLDGPARREIGALAAITVVDLLVARHPELMPSLSGFAAGSDPLDSPIERICACDQSGSTACGCSVTSTGPGSCNYRVMCHTITRAACSAINLQMCIAETVGEIVSPFGRPNWRSEDAEPRQTRGSVRPR